MNGYVVIIQAIQLAWSAGLVEPCIRGSRIMEHLLHRLRRRKFPGAVKDFLVRLIEPDDIVPAVHNRQIVGLLGISAEMDGDAAVLAFFPGDVID